MVICHRLWQRGMGRLVGMNWTTVILTLAVFAAFFLLRRKGQISTKEALARLKSGALVIDVRSPVEFSAGHLPKAVNLPLDEIEKSLPGLVRDKHQALLLHCQSGMRSGIAQKRLRAMGYTHAFNLGSYGRAVHIAKGGV